MVVVRKGIEVVDVAVEVRAHMLTFIFGAGVLLQSKVVSRWNTCTAPLLMSGLSSQKEHWRYHKAWCKVVEAPKPAQQTSNQDLTSVGPKVKKEKKNTKARAGIEESESSQTVDVVTSRVASVSLLSEVD